MSDIVVIGGGIAGLSAAAVLCEHADITLLEAEEATGYHASGRSAALTEKNYGAASVQRLNRISFDHLQDGGYLSARGLMVLAKKGEEEQFARDICTLNTDEISREEACALVPVLDTQKLVRAAYHAEAFDIDTDRLLQDCARRIRSAGGRIVTRARASRITRENGHWQITAGDQSFSAKKIVNAAGAWADQVAKLAGVAPLPITPHRRSIARIPAPGGHDVSDWPLCLGAGESWYAKPDAGYLLVSPADEDPVEPHDAWAEDLTLAEGIARYEEIVTTPVTRVQSNWAGLRSFAPDRSLVLGPDPAMPDFIWCAGQGGYGFQTSFAAAEVTAALALGRVPDLPTDTLALLTPERLR